MVYATAGRLRHKVHLQRKQADGYDAAGTQRVDWKTYASVWASVEPVRQSEEVQGERVEGRITHTIGLRSGPDIRHDDQVVWRGRTFEVQGPPRDLDERGILILLSATETTASSLRGAIHG